MGNGLGKLLRPEAVPHFLIPSLSHYFFFALFAFASGS